MKRMLAIILSVALLFTTTITTAWAAAETDGADVNTAEETEGLSLEEQAENYFNGNEEDQEENEEEQESDGEDPAEDNMENIPMLFSIAVPSSVIGQS